MARELNRQLQELQIQLKRNRAKIAEDAQQLEVLLVLTMLLSTGEQLPVHHFDILNVDFLNFLLNLVEATDDDGTPDDQVNMYPSVHFV